MKKETDASEVGTTWKHKLLELGCGILLGPFIGAAGALFILPFVFAGGVFLYQCFLWLKDGEWVEMSATLFFKYFLSPDNPFVQWVDNPQSWYGLHYLLTATPLSVFLFLVGLVIFFVYFVVAELLLSE
ncbi:hypothetical protein MYX84_00950 [Acidobacteria bacterium AH-259-O06]|nr:hypothetical protein [Acidobacteria bacterium AH-259-O06]